MKLDASAGGLSGRLRCGSERVFGFDSASATVGLCGYENRRSIGTQADWDVVENAGGGTAGGRRDAEGEPEHNRNAARWSDLTPVVEYLSALGSIRCFIEPKGLGSGR